MLGVIFIRHNEQGTTYIGPHFDGQPVSDQLKGGRTHFHCLRMIREDSRGQVIDIILNVHSGHLTGSVDIG